MTLPAVINSDDEVIFGSGPYGPIRSRFPAAASALYNQLPRVAMLAATLP